MIHLGIIGCGWVVSYAHVKALQRLTDIVKVVALADPSPGRNELVGEELGVPPSHWYADYSEMIEQEELDCVDLALPHFLHEPITIDCVQHGLHIFSDKPLATSLQSADRILKAVEQARVIFGIAHNYLYHSVYPRSLELIAEDRIGRPFFIRHESCGGDHNIGAESYDPDWRIRSRHAGGGVLLDLGYHNIYTAEALMGSPVESVSGRVGTFATNSEVDDTAAALLYHANGGVTSVQVSRAVKGTGASVLEVHGTKGSLRCWETGDTSLEIFENSIGEWKPQSVTAGMLPDSFFGTLHAFFTAVEGNDPPRLGAAAARHNLAVIEAIYRASAENSVIRVSKVGHGNH